jgi:predicted Mrr-cat superfamily restriction endonuclease
LELRPGDYVIYPNVPDRGQCLLGCVASGYFWKWDSFRRDFSHRFSLVPDSLKVFCRNADIVKADLRQALSNRRGWQRIYCLDSFQQLLDKLVGYDVAKSKEADVDSRLRDFKSGSEPIWKNLTGILQRTHPNFVLEDLLEEVFRKVSGVVDVEHRKPRNDNGAYLLVTAQSLDGWLEHRIVVQVRAYTGEMADTGVIDTIRYAMDYFGATHGLVMTTATSLGSGLRQYLNQLSEDRIEFVYGDQLLLFILHHIDLDDS